MTFDEARATHPSFGFAVYAMTPGEGVTLEVYAPDGGVFAFTGPTEQSVIDQAFPPEPTETAPPANAFD